MPLILNCTDGAVPEPGGRIDFSTVFRHPPNMVLNLKQKDLLKKELVSCLSGDQEIRRIVIFGSFVDSASPEDMDVAVFQDSDDSYLALAMKYRTQARSVSRRIPLDIIPLRAGVTADPFLKEIERGETIYER